MTDTSQQKMRVLVESLYERTIEKSVKWKPAFSDEAVEASFGRYTIRITEEYDRDSEDFYHQVVLKDGIGNVLDTITPASIGGEAPRVGGFVHYWQLMQELYRTAHRQASGADEAIDEILSELKKK